MSLQATLTFCAPDLRTAASAGCSFAVAMADCGAFYSAGAPLGMPISRSVSATALTACCISLRPMAPMQPTRKVSSCVSLPG